MPGDRVEKGRRYVGVAPHACGAEIRFVAGGAAVADDVVGADGIHSVVTAALTRYETLRRPRTSRVREFSRGDAERFHLPDGPAQRARDAAMASSYGLSPDIDWL